MNKHSFILLTAVVTLSLPQFGFAEPIENPGRPQFVPGELLVQYQPGTTAAEKKRALGRIKADLLDKVVAEENRDDGHGELVLIRHQPDFTPEQARKNLEDDPAVAFAEPNWIYTHQVTSNDHYFTNGSLWGMSAAGNQFGSQAATAWNNAPNTPQYLGSNTVYIGIIDEGYMYTHEDLANNAGKNPGEIEGNGIDDDNNGYIDDVYGWDFAGNNNSVFDGTSDDHGTHVAGTIGAVGGNLRGVAGVVWNVKLISAKFLGSNGGTTANAIKAVDYMTDLKINHGVNLVATNNSWGGGGYSQGLYEAIENANKAGILFVAAAGNATNNNDTTASYPASYTNANIISVASITSSGALSSFSNYGATSVDLGAPGSGIWSTVPLSSKGRIVSGYASYSGTSMATPHVTGALALYASLHPEATAADIKTAILDSALATPTPSLNGKCVTGGRLNVGGF